MARTSRIARVSVEPLEGRAVPSILGAGSAGSGAASDASGGGVVVGTVSPEAMPDIDINGFPIPPLILPDAQEAGDGPII